MTQLCLRYDFYNINFYDATIILNTTQVTPNEKKKIREKKKKRRREKKMKGESINLGLE